MANSSIMASSSATITSLLNTINVTANSVTKTVNSAADGLDMLQAYVTKAKQEQTARHKIEKLNYINILKETSADEIAERQKKLQNKLSQDTVYANLFKEAYEEITAALTETLPEA